MMNKIRSHYRILEKPADGGMGVVYKTQHTKLDRIVAVKFLPEYLLRGEVAKTRFVQEAKVASALDHPNITAICEIDDAESKCPVCMEHVERKPIKQLMFVTETSRRDPGSL